MWILLGLRRYSPYAPKNRRFRPKMGFLNDATNNPPIYRSGPLALLLPGYGALSCLNAPSVDVRL